MRSWLVGLFAFLAVATAPKPAQACLPFAQGPLTRWTFPPPRTTGVPLNAAIWVGYVYGENDAYCESYGCDVDNLRAVELRTVDDAVVPTHVEDSARFWGRRGVYYWVRLRPDELLLSDVEYVIHTRADPSGECTDCPWVAAATFRTGVTTDTTPPTFDGLDPLMVTTDSDPSYTSCGVYAGNTYDLSWPPASDEGPILYRVAFGSEPGIYVLSRLGVSVYDVCGGSPYLIWADFSDDGPAYVHAVDLAGNEDTNAVIRPFDTPCPEVPPLPGTPDASPDSSAGCNAVGGRLSDIWTMWLALGVAYCVRRRR